MNEKIKWIEPHQRYAFCALSVIAVRSEAKDSAEQISQLLFGEPIEVLAYAKPWIKIRSYLDGYEGYIDHKQVFSLTEKELKRWMSSYTFANEHLLLLNGPMGAQWISGGSLVGNQSDFQIGSYRYHLTKKPAHSEAWAYALGFLNTPYLWGGKSVFGTDCSGFVQNVFRQLDINLPRDAYQQAEMGTAIAFEQRQQLDLAFFKNAADRIYHVGIVGNDQQIIHASGQVRIDLIKQEGIFNDAADTFTHSLFEIRRLF